MLEVVQVLMHRDNLSEAAALEQVRECRAAIEDSLPDGAFDPEEIVMDCLGLEPDYIFEILGA